MKEQSRCFTLDLSGRIEVLHATYQHHAFAPHWHEQYAIGVIDSGIERFQYGGATHCATPGQLVLLNAGEIHTGEAFDERGFAFSMLYVPISTFESLHANPPQGALHFRRAIVDDIRLRDTLLEAHAALRSTSTTLERESKMALALARVLARTTSWRPGPSSLGIPEKIARAREYLHAHLFAEVSLDTLAHIVGLSRFHLLRAFRARFGLPPHAYQLQQRIFAAKRLLHTLPPADVAVECGFTDQSHLNRVFRAFAGTTPGVYAQQFRPIPPALQTGIVR